MEKSEVLNYLQNTTLEALSLNADIVNTYLIDTINSNLAAIAAEGVWECEIHICSTAIAFTYYKPTARKNHIITSPITLATITGGQVESFYDINKASAIVNEYYKSAGLETKLTLNGDNNRYYTIFGDDKVDADVVYVSWQIHDEE